LLSGNGDFPDDRIKQPPSAAKPRQRVNILKKFLNLSFLKPRHGGDES
jgi:hypothetical protein